MTTVEGKILKTHLRACLKESLSTEGEFDDKVEEIVNILKR
jgi:DNA-binding FrmR family transcriptional regulator